MQYATFYTIGGFVKRSAARLHGSLSCCFYSCAPSGCRTAHRHRPRPCRRGRSWSRHAAGWVLPDFLLLLLLGGILGGVDGLLCLDLGALVLGHAGLDLLNGLLDLCHGVDILFDQGGVLLTGLVQAVDQCAELNVASDRRACWFRRSSLFLPLSARSCAVFLAQ